MCSMNAIYYEHSFTMLDVENFLIINYRVDIFLVNLVWNHVH